MMDEDTVIHAIDLPETRFPVCSVQSPQQLYFVINFKLINPFFLQQIGAILILNKQILKLSHISPNFLYFLLQSPNLLNTLFLTLLKLLQKPSPTILLQNPPSHQHLRQLAILLLQQFDILGQFSLAFLILIEDQFVSLALLDGGISELSYDAFE